MRNSFLYICLHCTLLWSQSTFSQEFLGCGEYHFKGILRKTPNTISKITYIVHENTKSEMRFSVSEIADEVNLSLFLNVPTEFTAKILKIMDGTKGVISDPNEISKRLPNPLGNRDTELKKLNTKKCEF